MREPFAVALSSGELGARLPEFGFDSDHFIPTGFDLAEVEPPKGIEKRTVAPGIKQPAIILLSVDLDREAAEFAEESSRHARPAEEGAASTVAFQDAPNDQRLARSNFDSLLAEQRTSRMIVRKLDFSRYSGRFLAGAEQAGIGTGAQR